MKVLMLGWELPPHNSGGLGVACYQLSKALSKKGVDIEFVLPYTAEHSIDFMRINAAHPQNVAAVLKTGIAYDSFKYITKDGEIKWVDMAGQSAIYEEAVGKIAELAEFDVIHAHDWLTCRAGLRAKMVSGKPLIVHIHSIEADRAGQPHGGNSIVREIEAVSMMMADHIIAVSQHTKDGIVREYGIPADKIEVIHNSIDPADLAPLDGNNAYRYLDAMKSLGYRVVVNVGRLSVQKGLTNLLRAYAKAAKSAPKSFLLIVGSGEQYYELIALAAELGIGDKVLFTDFQRGKNWRDAFAIGDVFVMPSVSEPFGITPLESISYGTPALISMQSGVSEVLRNVLKVDFWDIDEMANQIAAILQNDPLRDELYMQSYKELQHFSWDDSAEKLLKTYRKHKAGASA
jgi:glycogen synthase